MLIPVRIPGGGQAFAEVDDEDAPLVSGKAWTLRQGYAMSNALHPTKRRVRPGKGSDRKPVGVSMHRLILGLAPGDRTEVDHRNRNRLDNRRSNLRLATRAQNAQNRRPNTQSSASLQPWSPYRGVHWDPSTQKWKAQVRGRHLGLFSTDAEANAVAEAERERVMPFNETGV